MPRETSSFATISNGTKRPVKLPSMCLRGHGEGTYSSIGRFRGLEVHHPWYRPGTAPLIALYRILTSTPLSSRFDIERTKDFSAEVTRQ
jgi:hypothetical protein